MSKEEMDINDAMTAVLLAKACLTTGTVPETSPPSSRFSPGTPATDLTDAHRGELLGLPNPCHSNSKKEVVFPPAMPAAH